MLDYIKRALCISWCPEEEEDRLNDQIKAGQAFLEKYDPGIDWDNDEEARPLLAEYVRYVRANARDDFKLNYFDEILSLATRRAGSAGTENEE